MPAPPSVEPAITPERIGAYRLIRPISVGGMAKVYEARLDSLAGVSTRVAIKVIHPDFANESGFQELFIHEARISARLEHLNVVRVQQFNREGSLYYLVMEYIDGVTFRKIVSMCRKHDLRVPPALLAELGRQVCDGLHYAHVLADEAGQALHLVHRDMKPSNLMLNVHGVAKVLDFGISYAHGSTESRGSVKGTWGYMAPEQAEGERVGPTSDLFGLAAVLYELAALEPLFPETENGTIRRALAADEAARRTAGLGGAYTDLAGVLVRALQRDPAARFQSAEAMGRALGGLVADPMSARDELVRFGAELRRLDAGNAPPAGDRVASAHSVSTMHPGGLPVVTGSVHAPKKPLPRRAERPSADRAWLGTLLSAGFAVVAVAVLLFTIWTILGRPVPWRTSEPLVAAAPVAPPAAVAVPAEVVVEGAPASAPPAAPEAANAAAAPPEPTISPPTELSPRPETASRPAPRERDDPPPRVVPVAPNDGAARPRTADLVSELKEAPPTAPASAEGLLTVSSTPRAQVMVDGAYVRFTPLFQHSLEAGSHTVLLVSEDGRRKSFRVEVPGGGEVRRIWLFDENRWDDGTAP